MEWRTIDSAPTEGGLLLIGEEGNVGIGEWVSGRYFRFCDSEGFVEDWCVATHWMPLPDPPK